MVWTDRDIFHCFFQGSPRPEDAKAKPEDAKAKPEDAKAKPEDAKAKPKRYKAKKPHRWCMFEKMVFTDTEMQVHKEHIKEVSW